MEKILFTRKMKLADLISKNHNLILMLPRLGIPLGFGDKSVEEVCTKYNVPTDFFLLICNVYSFDAYLPAENDVLTTDMSRLIPYLRASHRYYLDERLPHIEWHINRIADNTDPKYGHLLRSFFAGYKNELSVHFIYEETTVFPYIETLMEARRQEKYCISDFEDAHKDIQDKLNDLLQIIFKYLPGNASQSDSVSVVLRHLPACVRPQ